MGINTNNLSQNPTATAVFGALATAHAGLVDLYG
jgi:hypothetical protein